MERLRYNQFARMLNKKGGWEVQELPRLTGSPPRPSAGHGWPWTRQLTRRSRWLTPFLCVFPASPGGSRGGQQRGAARRALEELRAFIQPMLQPLLDDAGKVKKSVVLEPRVATSLQALRDFEVRWRALWR